MRSLTGETSMTALLQSQTAQDYLDLLGDDSARKALLACSAALSLDDEVARQAIEVVAQSNGTTVTLLKRIKSLGCVWRQWDGTWYVAEDVRPCLVDVLEQEVPAAIRVSLRETLAGAAEQRLRSLVADGQLATYRVRATRLEAGYQRTLTPGQEEAGAEEILESWKREGIEGKAATEAAVEHLAPELERHASFVPPQVMFLRGMAARKRGDRANAERHFRAVWENGRPGYIFALAAHFFGNLTRDRMTAERALRDSLAWNPAPDHQGQVLHSLGNLLARDRSRVKDAEDVFKKSLNLLHDPQDQGQVFHSLGNLLAKDRSRAKDAEDAFKKSLELLRDSEDQAQVLHSLGNLLAKDRARAKDAEDAFKKSLNLRHDPEDQGQVFHSLGNLLAKNLSRTKEAEDAFKKSLNLLHDPGDQVQILSSRAIALSRWGRQHYDDAERFALEARKLAPSSLQTRATTGWALANVHEGRGDLQTALKFLQEVRDLNRQQNRSADARRAEKRIQELELRIQARN